MTGIFRRDIIAAGAAGSALLAARTTPASAAASTVPPAEIGAAGDGRADDTKAIQAALDAAFSGPKAGFVRIPPGSYRITRSLRIETREGREGNLTFGHGLLAHGVRLVSAITDGSPVLELVSRSTVRFTLLEGLTIQGNGREGHGLSVSCQKRGTYFYNFCLRDTVIQGCGQDGLAVVGNVFEGQLFNCYFRDNKRHGASFSHGPENTVVSAVHAFGCVFGGNGEHGAALVNGAADVTFHGCYFLLNGKFGISAESGCTLLSNCGFENNHQKAQTFENGDAGVRLMVFGTLIGCTAYSIHRQTHLIRAFITNQLVMVGCTASGGGQAKGAKLAKLHGKSGASVSLIGCQGGVEQTKEIQAVELGTAGVGARLGGRWDSANLAQLGEHVLWVDAKGQLRIKAGRPTSDEDGRPVGS